MTSFPITYTHRAKPYAPEVHMALEKDAVRITQAGRSGDVPYGDIVGIRLTYTPRNTTNEGYKAKLLRRDNKGASVTNLTWKSLVQHDRQDEDYDNFIRALIARVVEHNPTVALYAGTARWRFFATAVAGMIAVLALAVVTLQAALGRNLQLVLLTGGLTAYFGWWAFRYLTRNRPRTFTANAIPADVMPQVARPA